MLLVRSIIIFSLALNHKILMFVIHQNIYIFDISLYFLNLDMNIWLLLKIFYLMSKLNIK